MVLKKRLSKALSFVLSLAMILTQMPLTALAVGGVDSNGTVYDGDVVAADGTYTSSTYYNTSAPDDVLEEDEWTNYGVSVSLTVSNGVFTAVTVTTDDSYTSDSDSYYKRAAVNASSKYGYSITATLLGYDSSTSSYSYNVEATYNSINNWDTTTGATYSYTAIKAAALDAISQAEAASDDTTDTTTIDYTALNSYIEQANALTESDYTAESWAVLSSALSTATALVNEAMSQDEVDSAVEVLKSAIEGLVEASVVYDGDTATVEIAGITYQYFIDDSGQAADGYEEIDSTGVYYCVADGEDALEGTLYGTSSLTYEEFYSAYVTSGYTYDAVTTATTGDYAMFTNMYTDYDEETSVDGYNILGVSNVNVAVDAELYVETAILDAAGVTLSTSQEEVAAITLNTDDDGNYDSTEPSQYLTLTVTDEDTYSYSGELNVIDTVTDATAELATNSTWGEYEIDVTENSTLYLRNSRSDTYTDDDGNTQTYAVGSGITGIILTAVDDEGNEISVGLAYLANIWIQPYKLSFNVSDTAATKNIAYSGDTAKYAALVGKTITSITYLTADGAYVYKFSDGIYVKVAYDGTVTGEFSDSDTSDAYDFDTLTIDSSMLPSDILNAEVAIEYTVGSGKTSTTYTLYSGSVSEDGTYTIDYSSLSDESIEALEAGEGSYSVTITSDNYADIDVAISILDSQVEELKTLIAIAETILSGTSDSTLTSHKEEAEEMLEDEDATMTDAYDLIDELEELLAEYLYSITVEVANCTVEVDDSVYAYQTVTFAATIDDGYESLAVSVVDADGNAIEVTDNGDGTYSFVMLESDATVIATAVGYSISASDGDNYTVDVEDTAAAGDTVTFTVTAADGYTVGAVSVVDADGNAIEVTDNGDGTYSFVMPASSVSIGVSVVADETAADGSTDDSSDSSSPKTADENDISIMLMLLALSTCVVIAVDRKRRNN